MTQVASRRAAPASTHVRALSPPPATHAHARTRVRRPQPMEDAAYEPTMDVNDVARACVYMASLPKDANVLTMTVMANGMPFVGRG